MLEGTLPNQQGALGGEGRVLRDARKALSFLDEDSICKALKNLVQGEQSQPEPEQHEGEEEVAAKMERDVALAQGELLLGTVVFGRLALTAAASSMRDAIDVLHTALEAFTEDEAAIAADLTVAMANAQSPVGDSPDWQDLLRWADEQ